MGNLYIRKMYANVRFYYYKHYIIAKLKVCTLYSVCLLQHPLATQVKKCTYSILYIFLYSLLTLDVLYARKFVTILILYLYVAFVEGHTVYLQNAIQFHFFRETEQQQKQK